MEMCTYLNLDSPSSLVSFSYLNSLSPLVLLLSPQWPSSTPSFSSSPSSPPPMPSPPLTLSATIEPLPHVSPFPHRLTFLSSLSGSARTQSVVSKGPPLSTPLLPSPPYRPLLSLSSRLQHRPSLPRPQRHPHPLPRPLMSRPRSQQPPSVPQVGAQVAAAATYPASWLVHKLVKELSIPVCFFFLRFSFSYERPTAGLGACGITNKDTDYIAAVSHLLFDNFPYVSAVIIPRHQITHCSTFLSGYKAGNPNNNPMCGRRVIATCKSSV